MKICYFILKIRKEITSKERRKQNGSIFNFTFFKFHQYFTSKHVSLNQGVYVLKYTARQKSKYETLRKNHSKCFKV